jgi:hypothetical protein
MLMKSFGYFKELVFGVANEQLYIGLTRNFIHERLAHNIVFLMT